MKSVELSPTEFDAVLNGQQMFVSAGSGVVLKLSMRNGSVVIDKITEEHYNKRYATGREGGGPTPTPPTA